MEVNFERRVGQYVALRDKIGTLEDEFKEKIKPYKDMLEQLNGVLLQHLMDTQSESVRTEAGTVYRSTKKSASLADADAFMTFVIDNHAFELLDRKANVTAVEDYIAEHKNPPPGVNFSQVFTANIRRPTKQKDPK